MIRRLASLSVLALGAVLLALAFQTAPAAQVQGVAWYNRCQVVSPSDTVDLAPFSQNRMLTGLIYVGGTGTMTTVAQDGTTTLWSAVPVAAQFQVGVRRINATGTTATLIVACWRQ